MSQDAWFDDIAVIGAMSDADANAKLQEIDVVSTDTTDASQPIPPFHARSFLNFEIPAWKHTTHAFGYIAPFTPGDESLQPVWHAGSIAPDISLKNSRIKVTLDRLRIVDYPGNGMHRVLFDFYAQNQVMGQVEHLHFNVTHRVQEGEMAGIINYPIFLGLSVGSNGLAFKCFTVNVSNDTDEAFLCFLDSDTFRGGLKLTTTFQPAIAPFSSLAYALTKSIATRNRNVPVQDFYMGLDFSSNPMGARLAIGSYLAVQIPEISYVTWNWKDWSYNPINGQIVRKDDMDKFIPYNYIAFSISQYEEV